VNDLLSPLDRFYRVNGASPPTVSAMDGADLPMPHRDLLVHEQDMTSKLEAFVGQSLSLRIIETREETDGLSREVVLVGDDDGRAAEFGAIRIYLDRLPDRAARRVREGRRPLGGILLEEGIELRCRPTAFFEVPSDAVMKKAFGFDGDRVLYGRHNLLYGPDDALLAEVVEIIP